MASRPAKPEEIANGKAKGVAMKETFVAYDGIAVIVNAANPIKGSDTLGAKLVPQLAEQFKAQHSGTYSLFVVVV
jgi:hypothetical protein